MAKPTTKVNVGATLVAGTAETPGRELPAVDPNPATSPEAARLIGGATTASVGAPAPTSPEPPATAMVSGQPGTSGGLIVDKLRVSMTAEAVTTLDEVERIFRRATGENISSGRVMRAGLRLLARLSQEQLIQAIEGEPEASPGRPAK